jgi:prophage DNA circulation protein
MELKFVAAKKPDTINTAVQRRQRLVRRLDQQINLIKSAVDGMLPRASWLWMDEKGAYFLPIKYGRHPIEMKKGMFAIQCKNAEEAMQALITVRSMVLNGEIDEQLAQASQNIRSRFAAK